MALNYIDNLDARLEMFAAGYLVAKPIADRIYDRVRPLPGNLVKPLEKFRGVAKVEIESGHGRTNGIGVRSTSNFVIPSEARDPTERFRRPSRNSCRESFARSLASLGMTSRARAIS